MSYCGIRTLVLFGATEVPALYRAHHTHRIQSTTTPLSTIINARYLMLPYRVALALGYGGKGLSTHTYTMYTVYIVLQ